MGVVDDWTSGCGGDVGSIVSAKGVYVRRTLGRE
jgi:hypothetical protein